MNLWGSITQKEAEIQIIDYFQPKRSPSILYNGVLSPYSCFETLETGLNATKPWQRGAMDFIVAIKGRFKRKGQVLYLEPLY